MYDNIAAHWHALLFEELNISSIYHGNSWNNCIYHHTNPFEHTHPGPSPFRSQALGAKLRLAGPKWFDQLGQGHCGQRGLGRWWVSPLGKMHPFWLMFFSDGLVQPPTVGKGDWWHVFLLDFWQNAQTECLGKGDFWVQTYSRYLALRDARPEHGATFTAFLSPIKCGSTTGKLLG